MDKKIILTEEEIELIKKEARIIIKEHIKDNSPHVFMPYVKPKCNRNYNEDKSGTVKKATKTDIIQLIKKLPYIKYDYIAGNKAKEFSRLMIELKTGRWTPSFEEHRGKEWSNYDSTIRESFDIWVLDKFKIFSDEYPLGNMDLMYEVLEIMWDVMDNITIKEMLPAILKTIEDVNEKSICLIAEKSFGVLNSKKYIESIMKLYATMKKIETSKIIYVTQEKQSFYISLDEGSLIYNEVDKTEEFLAKLLKLLSKEIYTIVKIRYDDKTLKGKPITIINGVRFKDGNVSYMSKNEIALECLFDKEKDGEFYFFDIEYKES